MVKQIYRECMTFNCICQTLYDCSFFILTNILQSHTVQDMDKKDALVSFRTCKKLKEKITIIAAREDRSFSSQMVRFLKQGVTKWEEVNRSKASRKLQ